MREVLFYPHFTDEKTEAYRTVQFQSICFDCAQSCVPKPGLELATGRGVQPPSLAGTAGTEAQGPLEETTQWV